MKLCQDCKQPVKTVGAMRCGACSRRWIKKWREESKNHPRSLRGVPGRIINHTNLPNG